MGKDVSYYVMGNLRVLFIFIITLLQGLALEILKNILGMLNYHAQDVW